MRALILLIALLFIGCATSTPSSETVKWYNQITREWVQSVQQSCDRLDWCRYQGFSLLVVDTASLPEREEVRRMVSAWCRSVSAYSGQKPAVEFRYGEVKARTLCL